MALIGREDSAIAYGYGRFLYPQGVKDIAIGILSEWSWQLLGIADTGLFEAAGKLLSPLGLTRSSTMIPALC
ncbi:MAG: hypothetical protein K2W95_07505 [Candidatus Obscuribacterales bacterium]|nr:hypothetical protein [Candidatus Obscuribacterales bacterium]